MMGIVNLVKDINDLGVDLGNKPLRGVQPGFQKGKYSRTHQDKKYPGNKKIKSLPRTCQQF